MGQSARGEAIAAIGLGQPSMNALNARVRHEIAAAAARAGTDPRSAR